MVALDIDLDRNPLLVSPTRRYVEGVLRRLIKDPDLIARAAIGVHELVDNGSKYAPVGARIGLSMTLEAGTSPSLMIRLTNRTTAVHVERLRRFISEVNGAEDATALYVDMMCRHPLDRTSSGLGLARIRAEAEMSLDLIVGGETATIVARTAAPTPQAA